MLLHGIRAYIGIIVKFCDSVFVVSDGSQLLIFQMHRYNEVKINLYMIENIIEYMKESENYQSVESYDMI